MRARLFVVARFLVYAAIIAVGVHVLLDRGEAKGQPSTASGVWVDGKTTAGLPVSVRVADHRVEGIRVTWRAHCDYGAVMVRETSLESGFEHDGRRFSLSRDETHPGWVTQTGRLHTRVRGEAAGGVVRGSVDSTLEIYENGHVVVTCTGGSTGFALDLPQG